MAQRAMEGSRGTEGSDCGRLGVHGSGRPFGLGPRLIGRATGLFPEAAMQGIGVWTALGVLLLSASAGRAVTPAEWTQATQAQFERGEPRDVSVTSEGAIVLSSARKELTDADSLELLVWALVEDAQGNLYAGTGNKGKILKIDAGGRQSLFFDSPEVAIHSLAVDEQGTLFAGGSPDGIVYRITPGSTAATFVAEDNSYIWSLVLSASGRLYAGTGEQGRLLELTEAGSFSEIYDSPDPHLMCLVADAHGNVYAGSEGSGVVYKFTDKGDVSVLYDAPEREIRCLALDRDGTLYVGAMGGPGPSQEGEPSPSRSGGEDNGPSGRPVDEVRRGLRVDEGPGPPIAEAGCTLYEISPFGAVTKIWTSPDPQLLSLIVDAAGRLIVGTGDQGKVYAVSRDGKYRLLAALDEAQPLCLLRRRDGSILVGTGNVGRIYELTQGYTSEGTYESEVHDAVIRSRWGKLFWRADVPDKTGLVLYTRTGNTQVPDETWSDWSDDLKDPEGSQIPSPASRFLQYRAKLSTSDGSRTPVLWEVHILGIEDNMAPKMGAVTVKPFTGPDDGLPPGVQMPQIPLEGSAGKLAQVRRGLVTVSWEASDPNGDAMVYDLFFRGTAERGWKPLLEDWASTAYLWDTESCPDGQTVLRVVASDRPGNPRESALSAERTSEPFYVDKLAPDVRLLRVRQLGDRSLEAEGEAQDATSRLGTGAFAVDAEGWQVIFPRDGIFDSKTEAFTFETEPLEPGEHTLVVRILDALGNVGVAKAVHEVK